MARRKKRGPAGERASVVAPSAPAIPDPPALRPPASRRRVVAALVLVAAVLALAAVFWARTRTRGPNLLLVTIDTLRADHVGVYGARDARTPNLDALAARGVRFAHAQTAIPLTGPAHATILTG